MYSRITRIIYLRDILGFRDCFPANLQGWREKAAYELRHRDLQEVADLFSDYKHNQEAATASVNMQGNESKGLGTCKYDMLCNHHHWGILNMELQWTCVRVENYRLLLVQFVGIKKKFLKTPRARRA